MMYDDEFERSSYNIHILENTSHLPRSIYCPISNMPMQDPVIMSDGNSYERKEIQHWYKINNTSPMTGKIIDNILIPNHALRNTISEITKSDKSPLKNSAAEL